MKLTLQLKLLPTEEQKEALLITMRVYNQAANYAAQTGFANKTFGQVNLHKLCYYPIRERFDVTSQIAIRAIAKAVECFQRDKKICPIFKEYGAITYDECIMSFKGLTEVSLWTVLGRQRIKYVCGDYQTALKGRIRGQADLVYRDGIFFLHCTIDLPEDPAIEIKGWFGIDLGIVNLTTDSEGEVHSGEQVQRNRRRRSTARKQYQRKGTRNAKRRLKSMSGRQARFQRHTNHEISRRIVDKAKALKMGIVLEDLTNIRTRIEPTVSRKYRRMW